ncbi:MAG: hypothetical protein HC794_07905, partial [Nitrospiraceae bacterium]|nr:hypothetical protein [Nitrospiraceae bacterium]
MLPEALRGRIVLISDGIPQMDDFDDADSLELDIPGEVLESACVSGTFAVTFPAAAESGPRTFEHRRHGGNGERD